MNHKLKFFVPVLLAIVALFLVVGCSSNKTQVASESDSVTLTDMLDREVVIKGDVKRIVALTPSDAEILYAIGAGDLVVGRGSYVNYPEEVLELPEVASGEELNIEQIIALDPDLVVMSFMGHTEEQISALEDTGVTVLMLEAKDLDGVYESIDLVGKAVGKEQEAAQVVTEMKDTFKKYSDLAKGKEGGTVYYEISPLEMGLWAAGSNTFMDEIGNMLGLENIFASDVDTYGEISEEQVLERNPDYIVAIFYGSSEEPAPSEEILARAGWQNVEAVKNKHVISVNNDTFSRPSPRLAEGIEELYTKVYGE